MDAVSENCERVVRGKVKDILPTLAPYVPASSATCAGKRRFLAAILCPGLWSRSCEDTLQ